MKFCGTDGVPIFFAQISHEPLNF